LSNNDSMLNALSLRFRKKYDTSMELDFWFFKKIG